MKKLWVAAIATVMFLGIQAYGEVKSVNVVGVMGVTINGDDAWTLLSMPMTKLPVARGLIDGNTTTTITGDGVTWDVEAFAPAAGGPANEPGVSTYYVEITSGGHEGRHFYIDSNTADVLTLQAEMDIPVGELAGAGFKIIPANRIRDIFGEPQVDVKLNTNDRIYMMQGSWASPIFYRDDTSFFTPKNCWIQDDGNVNDKVVDRDIGMMVLRRGAGDVTLSVTGEVSANAQGVVVVPGWSILGGMSAVPTAIGDASLLDALGGSQDRIYEWTPSGWSAPVFFRDASSFFTPKDCWVQNDINVNQTFIIEPGKAYMVRRADAVGELWNRESPLN